MQNNEYPAASFDLAAREQIIRDAEAMRAHYLRSFAAAGRQAVVDYVRSFMSNGHKTA